jgi:hypothetical protein
MPVGAARDAGRSVLPLPAVPHLDTIQWLNSAAEPRRRLKVLGPQVDDLSPFLIDPTAPLRQFSATEKAGRPQAARRPNEAAGK